MNEEEKKAIEILDTFELRRKTRNYKEISLEDTQSVKIVLNLIEKLQKENDELKCKEMNKTLPNDCIPKQKIKDKMKGLEWSLGGYDSKIASARHSQAIGAYMVLMDLLNGKEK